MLGLWWQMMIQVVASDWSTNYIEGIKGIFHKRSTFKNLSSKEGKLTPKGPNVRMADKPVLGSVT
jgi:hypothetical protein